MKALLVGGALIAVVGYAWYSRGEANVYPLTVAQTYEKLTTAKVEESGSGPLGNRDIKISGNGTDKIYWKAEGAHAITRCQADLSPEGASSTRITAFCDGASGPSGAAAGMLHGMLRKAMIEHIDSTLDGRPYDRQKARGETASGWPADVRQPDGSLGGAVDEAMKMDREFRNPKSDFNKQLKKLENDARAHENVNFRPGQPMTSTTPY